MRRAAVAAIAASAALLIVATPAAAIVSPPFKKAYTERLGQLITAPGHDGVNELNNPANGTLGMRGTDLGVSFESEGLLYFLFGDSWVMGGGSLNDDSIAATDATSVDRFQMPRLTWASDRGSFAPLRVRHALHGEFEVPVEGIRANGKTYVFFVSGFHRDPPGDSCADYVTSRCTHDHRVLGHFRTDTMQTGRFAFDQRVRTKHFLNVSAVKYRGYVYLFGAGNPYRKSAVWLARFRPQQIDRANRWRYYGGETKSGRPRWVQNERGARTIVIDNRPAPGSGSTATHVEPCVGELSVRRDPTSGAFLMAYNCNDAQGARPRGYYLRTAPRPWGRWSRPIVLFDPWAADSGFGVTQHYSTEVGKNPDDGLGEPDHLEGRDSWGGEYGPYLIPRFFRWEGPLRLSIVYAHSTWNPYKVQLMRTVLVPPGSSVGPPDHGAGVPRPTIHNGTFNDGIHGWVRLGTPFRVVTLENRNYVSSYVPQGPGEANGDDVQGALYQDFTLDDSAKSLCFRVHGGGVNGPVDYQTGNVAAVRLYNGPEIVRESFGWKDSPLEPGGIYQDVAWNIREFAGEQLRLVIADDATGPWGFIDATNFRFADDCGKPDLVVDEIYGLGTGNPLTVGVVVRNAGNSDAAPSQLALRLERRQTGERRDYLLDTPPLGAGQSTTVQTQCLYGADSATATADAGDAVAEGDETNNSLIRTGSGCYYP